MTQLRPYFYFDFNSTTPVHELVKSAVVQNWDAWGNPSSIHWASRLPKLLIREARQNLAKALGTNPLQLIFTSGGTEANNTIIKSVFLQSQRTEYITSQVEHPSVLKTFQYLQSQGAVVHFLPVNRKGFIDLEKYQSLLSERTALVSIMLANNETGNIFPIKQMAMMAHQAGALFHSDCVQGLGKIALNLEELGVDFASFSAHKFYSLKGCGLLYQRKGSPLEPLLIGGAQERYRRGGTENVLAIHAFGVMSSQLSLVNEKNEQIKALRDHLEESILREIPQVQITGKDADRLPNTSSLVIAGVDGETLLMSLDLKGFAVSTGAACASGNPEPSPTLLAMGLEKQEAQSSLRVSLGWTTTLDEVNLFTQTLKETVNRLRDISRVGEFHVDI